MIYQLPAYRRLESYRDKDDEDRLITRTNFKQDVVALPLEYEDYLKRKGKIYRVQKSQSGFSWILAVDCAKDPLGWDQDAYYVQTLVLCRNGSLEEALARAKKILPNEYAFYVPDQFSREIRPEDAAFEAWFNSL